MKMLTCSVENVNLLKTYVQDAFKFLNQYQWLVDVYVSDYFVLNHTEHIPTTWLSVLTEMSPPELSCLLTGHVKETRKVLPLSLLSFMSCTQTFSADRRPSTEAADSRPSTEAQQVWEKVCMLEDVEHRTNICAQLPPLAKGACFNPVNDDGVLHYFYKKHVKPKKQHEILQMGKIVHQLSQHCGCSNVVDVGAGLGHLARILSFGFGLKVTSVEASDGHAPKANKFDREMEREIKNKKKLLNEDDDPGIPNLPNHVTRMICPDTSVKDFTSIVQDKFQVKFKQEVIDDHGALAMESETVTLNERSSFSGMKPNTNQSEFTQFTGISGDISVGELKQNSKSGFPVCPCNKSGSPVCPCNISNTVCADKYTCQCQRQSKCVRDYYETNVEKTSQFTSTEETFQMSADKQLEPCIETEVVEACSYKNQVTNSPTRQGKRGRSKEESLCDFILTGLHACGDLTPTFVRCFVNLPSARGVASVGCCYMKLTCHDPSQSSDGSQPSGGVGYPMSQCVRDIPGYQLSYLERELACHSADVYLSRLKESYGHLKIHCYRAVLEWIYNQVCTPYKRFSVQIPAKKTAQLQLEGYIRLGFQKLGLSEDLLTSEILATSEGLLSRWKEVVIFYTLRLSLAPVIETLLLIDRMIFLQEQGLNSALVPVFDPKISPRNFVLLSWKKYS